MRVLAFAADVVNGQVVGFDLKAEMLLDALGERGKMKVGDPSATVAEQMVVRLHDLVKAIRRAVDVQAIDQSRLVHGVEVVVDRCHSDARHLQLREEEDLVCREVTVGFV